MIRFCDLRGAYWCDSPLPAPPHKGPFAFIDTVTDTFVEISGQRLFGDAEDFELCVESWGLTEEMADALAYVKRLRSFIPEWAK